MLYVNGDGVAWNGLVKVSEASTGGAVREFFLDGDKYLNLPSLEEYVATVEAVSAPKEFAPCEGRLEFYPGAYAANQPRQSFGFSYRTLIGNELDGISSDYKIHIVYNVNAKPADIVHQTITRTPNLKTYSWTFNTVPESFASYKPGSHFVIDTRTTNPGAVDLIEEMLYGTATTDPTLPTVAQLMGFLNVAYIDAQVVMNKMRVAGTGSTTATGSAGTGNISMKKMKLAVSAKGITKITAAVKTKKMGISASIKGITKATAAIKTKKMSVAGSGPGGVTTFIRGNTLEGGTNGTTVSTGNSGGASGDAFDLASAGSGATVAFENAQKAHGALSMAVATGGTAAVAYAGWNITARKFWGRFYIYRTATETANTRVAAAYGTSPASAPRGFIRIANGGKLVACDAASTILWTSTNALPINQWIRIEFMMDCDASAGQFNLSYYNTADGTTATESFSSTATQNLGGVPADFLFGVPIAQASVTKMWYDDMALSTVGPLGPAAETSVGTGGVSAKKMKVAGLIVAGTPFKCGGQMNTTGSTTRNVPVTTATEAGDTIVFIAGTSATACTVSSVTDNKGNVYTADKAFTTAIPVAAVFRADGKTGGPGGTPTVALTTSDQWTVTVASTTGLLSSFVVDLPATLVDVLDVLPSAFSTANSANPAASVTPTQDFDISLACFITPNAGGSPTVASPYTLVGTPVTGTSAPYASAAYQLLGAGTSGVAQTATETIVSGNWRAINYAFKRRSS